MKNWFNIGIAFLIGSFCRYVFYIFFGYISLLSVRFGIKVYFINLLPKIFSSTIFLFQILFETLISAFIVMILPVLMFGYYTVETKKRFMVYSVYFFIGVICFDLFYFTFVIHDLNLLIYNYLPIWYGATIVLIWIALFYWIYAFGKYLRLRGR